MRKILFILLLSPFVSSSQVKQLYNQYGGTWKRLEVKVGFRLPMLDSSTKDFNSAAFDSAQVYYNPADSSVYYYTGFQWLKVGTGDGVNIYNSSGILTGNRTLTGLNNTYYLRFDSLNSWRVSRAGQTRFEMTNAISRMLSPDGSSVVQATNGNAELLSLSSDVTVYRDDSISLNNISGIYKFRRIPYNSDANLVSLVVDTTNDRVYRKTVSGGTPTFQQVFNTEAGGSVLTKIDTIDAGASSYLFLTGSIGTSNTSLIRAINSNTGGAAGIYGQGFAGVQGHTIASSGVGVNGSAAGSSSQLGGSFSVDNSATNSVFDVMRVSATSSGTVAAGFGGSILFRHERASGSQLDAGRITAKWTDVTNGAEVMQWDITGKGGAGTDDKFMNIQRSGIVRVNNLADTLATLYDVRAGGGGGSGTLSRIGTLDSLVKVANGMQVSGVSIIPQTADATYPGLLSNTDWTTFNNKNNISNANLTSTASHSYNLAGYTQTITNGTWLQDSTKFNPTPVYPTPDSLISYGNSITLGQNASPSDSAYIVRYGALLGLIVDNKAVSGRGIWRATYEASLAEYPGHTKMASVMAGFNDARRNGMARKTLNKIINGHKAIFVNHFLKFWVAAGNGANVTRTGTWTTNFTSSAIGGKSVASGAYTQTINDSITFTATGNNIVFSPIYGDGTTNVYSNSVEVYLDNVLQGTYSFDQGTDAVSDGADANTYQPGAFIFSGLSYGSHKVKLINKNNHPMVIDYFGQLVEPNGAYPLLIFHSPKMDATGYATSPANASDAIIDTVNAKIDSLFATFPTGYPVYKAQTNSYYTNTTASGDLDVADHIHPTNQGHRKIFNAASAALSSFTARTGTIGTVFWSGGRLWLYDSTATQRQVALTGDATGVTTMAAVGSSPNANGASISGNTLTLQPASVTQPGVVSTAYQTFLGDKAISGGFQIQGALSAPTGAGWEGEYTGGVAYWRAYNRSGSYLTANADANIWNFRVGTTTKLSIAANTGLTLSARVLEKQGAAVASANNLVLGTDGNTFEITGTTQINLLSNLSWQDGSTVTLLFTSTPTVKNGQTTSTTNIKILLAGAADFAATADDVLVLKLCTVGGVQAWREVSRSVN